MAAPRRKDPFGNILAPLVVIIFTIASLAALALFLRSTAAPPVPQPSYALNSAPSFSLRDPNGGRFSLSDYAGRKVLLVFFATDIPPSVSEIPFVIEGSQGLATPVFIGAAGEDAAVLYDFQKAQGIAAPVLMDLNGSVAAQYQAESVPLNVLIDEKGGSLKRWAAPFKSADEVRSWITG